MKMRTLLTGSVIGIAICATAQITVTLPPDTDQTQNNPVGPSPYNHFMASRHLQALYTASELVNAGASAGNVQSLAFFVTELNQGDLEGYTIRMANTLATSLASPVMAGLQTVRDAAPLPPGNLGWYTIPFDTPFAWDGSSNLVVDICFGPNASTSASGRVGIYNNIPDQRWGLPGACNDFGGTSYFWKFGLQLVMDLVTDIEEAGSKPLQIMTNPVGDVLWLQGALPAATTASVLDAQGRIVLQGAVQGGAMDVSELPAGSYIVRIQDQAVRFVRE